MILCGGAISALFDLFRAFRIVVRPNTVAVAVSDALFCVISLFCMAACVWNFNSGAFRFYEVTGVILGGIFYYFLLGRWIFRLFLIIIENIFKFVRFILKILLTPTRFLYKILIVPIIKRAQNIIQGSRGTYDKRIQKHNR